MFYKKGLLSKKTQKGTHYYKKVKRQSYFNKHQFFLLLSNKDNFKFGKGNYVLE